MRQALAERRLPTLAIKVSFLTGNLILWLLVAAGVLAARRRAWELLPIWALPAYMISAQLPMYAEPRYGLPLIPFAVIFAASAIVCRNPA